MQPTFLTPWELSKVPHSELPKSPRQGLQSTQLSQATLIEATFLSFHLRKTDIWVDWKVGLCPICLGTGCVNPKAPFAGTAGLAHSLRFALVGSSCLPRDHLSICLAWDGFTSEPKPLPASPGRTDSCPAPSKNSAAFPLETTTATRS